ncbi:TIGR02679 domain-containing protein [Streptomyces sp. NPDC008222]|uniref:TIGR02679 domain-containing protein n=2 Tax=unclassified Streptomyces TaxID=2593676 RepID=UPI0036EF30AC
MLGLRVELLWKLDEDVDEDLRAAVELLRSPSSLRRREQTEQLREVLQRRIEDARRADPSAGHAAHLRTALDYRDWFRFHTFVVEDAAPGRRRRLTGRTGLSQGEQRVLSYLVLFAAAAAHFTSLAESAPYAPRLILLDDGVSGLPSATRGWLTGPGLTRLWEGVRKRLESNRVLATGSLRLTALNTQERNDLSLLLGEPLTRSAVTVRLDVPDARLRASAAGLGLRETLEELGPPLTDRRAARADVAARWEQVWSSLSWSLDASPLAGQECPGSGTTCCAGPACREK